MDSFTKQPKEVLDYDIDFTDWMVTGDTVTGTKVSVDGGTFATSYSSSGIDITISNASTSIPKLWISNGVHLTTYQVAVQVTTTGGRIKEIDFKMKIKEIS